MKLSELKQIHPTFLFLFENKQELLIKQFGPKLIQSAKRERTPITDAGAIIQQLQQADPTNGKMLTFLCKVYANENIKMEDLPIVKNALTIWTKVKNRLPSQDINRYQRIQELYRDIEQFNDQAPEEISKKSQKDLALEQECKWIIDTNDFKVVVPLTQKAATYYGSGTSWCTTPATGSAFETYKNAGDIYIIFAGDKKYQLHMEEDQFKDKSDDDLSESDIKHLSKFPQYKQFLEMMIQKYYKQWL